MGNVLYGLQVAGIGLVVVFTGLIILIVCISIMAQIFKGINAKKEAKAKAAVAAAAPAPTAAPAPVVAQEPEEEIVQDTELIAVIAAALAAFDDSGKQFVVRKVRRVSGWNRTARAEQIYRF